eukprot:COSAG06_NODE_43094_length_375_cov_0.782609_1_plen_35_part_01
MQIIAKLPTGRVVAVEVEGTDTVDAVAQKIFEKCT